MKREHIDEKYEIFLHYTLFEWCQCSKCGMDFRREIGLRFLTPMRRWKYVCSDCAQSPNINKFINNEEWIPPPPPPPRFKPSKPRRPSPKFGD